MEGSQLLSSFCSFCSHDSSLLVASSCMGAAGGEKKGGLISTQREREREREREILLFRAVAICVCGFPSFFLWLVSWFVGNYC